MFEVYLPPAEFFKASNESLTRRARVAAGEWLAELRPWSEFVSLTYDPHKRPDAAAIATMTQRPPPADRVRHDLVRWLKLGVVELGGLYTAVAATETHKSGWPHVHVIVEAPDAPQALFRDWCQEWFNAHGYATAEPCRDQQAASRYVSKYLVKEERELTFFPLAGPLGRATVLTLDGKRVKGS